MGAKWDIHLFDIAGTQITLVTLITFLIILIVTFLLARIVEAGIERAFRLRKITDEGTIGVARRLTHYFVLVTGLSIGLTNMGIDLSALFAAGAIFAVALGFAMQNIVQNFVSGVILLIERTIKPGDILGVENKVVKVVRMGIRATVARTLDDEEIIIPNSVLVQNLVSNYTLQDPLFRLRVEVGVVYSSDMALVRRTLEETARDIDWDSKEVEPRILLKRFGPSSVDFEISVWIDHPWRAQLRSSQLHEKIWWALQDRGIVIAFPQVDVHFDPPVMNSLGALAEKS